MLKFYFPIPGLSLEKRPDFALVWPSAIRNIVQGEMSVITIDIDFSQPGQATRGR
jgi:hypothetical protein